MRAVQLSLADCITLTRWVMAPLFWYAAWHQLWAYALAWWMAIWISDMIDGAVARAQGTVSVQGALLDTVIDKLIVLGACFILPVEGTLRAIMVGKELAQGALLLGAVRQGRIIAPRSLWVGKLTMVAVWLYMTNLMIIAAGWWPYHHGCMAFLWVLIVVGYGYSLWTYGNFWFKQERTI